MAGAVADRRCKWRKDSDMVFDAIVGGEFRDFRQAERAVVGLFVPDLKVSRAGISHALKRLERHYDSR